MFWLNFELLQRPDDQRYAYEEIAASHSSCSSPGNPSTNIDSLCSKPLLQSAYAETLRLYTSLFALRSPAHGDFHLGDWRIPEGKIIAVDSRVSHMDKHVWNTGRMATDGKETHPLSQFWAARFLEYDNDTTSGPLKSRKSKPKAVGVNPPLDRKSDGPRFTMEGLSGA